MDVRSIEAKAPVVEHNGTVPVWWMIESREFKDITDGGYLELVNEFEVPGGGLVDPHSHPTHEFYYVMNGKGVMTIDGEDRDISQGDLVFVRVGHRARRRSVGPWDTAGARAGLHPVALELLAERRIGVLGGDGNNDTAPSAVEGVDFPVHVLAVNAMGLHLLDYLDFEDLVTLCEELRRWSFLAVLAPLRLPAGTGSPINPIAIF